MSLTIVAQRCRIHPGREAVGRCPECTQFFCRECITEHDGRIICSTCLKKRTAKAETKRRSFAPVARVALAVLGFFVAWMFFSIVGRSLYDMPAASHEKSIWGVLEDLSE